MMPHQIRNDRYIFYKLEDVYFPTVTTAVPGGPKWPIVEKHFL